MTDVPAGLVDRLFGYVDKPWKVVAVIVLALAFAGGYAVWEQRAAIAERILRQTVTPRLEPDRFPKVADDLMSDTGADLVLFAEVSLNHNLIRTIAGRLAGEPNWRPAARPRPVFTAGRDFERVDELIMGKVDCASVVPQSRLEEERAEAALGMTRRCGVAVPPIPSITIGFLSLAWRKPLSSGDENGAKKVMYRAAERLATW
jgi:hypothetical protein